MITNLKIYNKKEKLKRNTVLKKVIFVGSFVAAITIGGAVVQQNTVYAAGLDNFDIAGTNWEHEDTNPSNNEYDTSLQPDVNIIDGSSNSVVDVPTTDTESNEATIEAENNTLEATIEAENATLAAVSSSESIDENVDVISQTGESHINKGDTLGETINEVYVYDQDGTEHNKDEIIEDLITNDNYTLEQATDYVDSGKYIEDFMEEHQKETTEIANEKNEAKLEEAFNDMGGVKEQIINEGVISEYTEWFDNGVKVIPNAANGDLAALNEVVSKTEVKITETGESKVVFKGEEISCKSKINENGNIVLDGAGVAGAGKVVDATCINTTATIVNNGGSSTYEENLTPEKDDELSDKYKDNGDEYANLDAYKSTPFEKVASIAFPSMLAAMAAVLTKKRMDKKKENEIDKLAYAISKSRK